MFFAGNRTIGEWYSTFSLCASCIKSLYMSSGKLISYGESLETYVWMISLNFFSSSFFSISLSSLCFIDSLYSNTLSSSPFEVEILNRGILVKPTFMELLWFSTLHRHSSSVSKYEGLNSFDQFEGDLWICSCSCSYFIASLPKGDVWTIDLVSISSADNTSSGKVNSLTSLEISSLLKDCTISKLVLSSDLSSCSCSSSGSSAMDMCLLNFDELFVWIVATLCFRSCDASSLHFNIEYCLLNILFQIFS